MKALALGVCLSIAFLVSQVAAQTDAGTAVAVHPNQRITVPNLPAVVATNDGGVARAAVAIVLSGSKVKCDPGSPLETVLEATAGSSLQAMASKLAGASCITNSRAQRLSATFTPNSAIQADSVIASLLQGRPLLMSWKRKLYVLYGVVYDEHLYYDGSRTNAIRQLLLIDPRYSDQRRFVAFARDKDNFADVEGIASVSIQR